MLGADGHFIGAAATPPHFMGCPQHKPTLGRTHMMSRPQMFNSSILRTLAIAVVFCSVIAAPIYASGGYCGWSVGFVLCPGETLHDLLWIF